MVVLRPKVDKPEKELSPHDYDTKNIVVDMNVLPLEDKIQRHKQTWDMVENDLIQATLNVRKLKLQITRLEN
jgi:hypothetical protein